MSNTKLNRQESSFFHFSVIPPASPSLSNFHTFYLMVAQIPNVPKTRCCSGQKGVGNVNRFTLPTPFPLDLARLLVITCGQPYSYSFPQSPHSQLPTFHPLLGLPTFRMFYLMVAKTLHFPFSRFRFVLPISHFPFRSVHVPLYILMGGI